LAQLPDYHQRIDRGRGDLAYVQWGRLRLDGNWGIHAIIKKSLFAGVSV
jgi:hypothetical protein